MLTSFRIFLNYIGSFFMEPKAKSTHTLVERAEKQFNQVCTVEIYSDVTTVALERLAKFNMDIVQRDERD